MERVLVIGYGNPLRGDDGFGRLAAELIAQRRVAGLDVIVAHQLGPEMAAPLSEADRAVFLDAELAGDAAALRATVVEPQRMPPTAISHRFSPGAVLALAEAAYGRAPTATLVTAAAHRFDYGADLSPELRAAAQRVADVIAALAKSGRLRTETVRAALAPPA